MLSINTNIDKTIIEMEIKKAHLSDKFEGLEFYYIQYFLLNYTQKAHDFLKHFTKIFTQTNFKGKKTYVKDEMSNIMLKLLNCF